MLAPCLLTGAEMYINVFFILAHPGNPGNPCTIFFMLKTIIDTNILIDAMTDDFSYTWKIIDLVLQGKIKAVASDKILKENRLIIERNIVKESDKQRLEKFFVNIEVVQVNKKIRVIKDDPQDDKFIECADETNADYIISSDRHLLNLEKYKDTKILSPKDFWYEYKNKSGEKDDEWKDVFKDILGS